MNEKEIENIVKNESKFKWYAQEKFPEIFERYIARDEAKGELAIRHFNSKGFERGFFRFYNLDMDDQLWTVDWSEQPTLYLDESDHWSGERWIEKTRDKEWILPSSQLAGVTFRATYQRDVDVYESDILHFKNLLGCYFNDRMFPKGFMTSSLIEHGKSKDGKSQDVITHFPGVPDIEKKIKIPTIPSNYYGINVTEMEHSMIRERGGKYEEKHMEYLNLDRTNKKLPEILKAIAGTEFVQGVLAPLNWITANVSRTFYDPVYLVNINYHRWLGGEKSTIDNKCVLLYGTSSRFAGPIKGISYKDSSDCPDEARLVRIVERKPKPAKN